MAQTKAKRTGKNAPHCEGQACKAYPHKETEKCYSRCSHCGINGHHMSLCYKLKFCQLCGKPGHNPYRCWTYSTIHLWILRAQVLHRCVDCLCPWKPHTVGDVVYGICTYCGGKNANDSFKLHGSRQTKESQTDENSHTDQESQTELKEGKAII